MLAQLSNFRVLLGLSGIGVGALGFVFACYDAMDFYSQPAMVESLMWAVIHMHAGHTSAADMSVFAQFWAEVVKVFGSFAIAMLLLYIGVPFRIKAVPADDSGANPSP